MKMRTRADNIPVQTIDGKTQTLQPFAGKVMLIVNVASKCGFTPQYTGLGNLWREYRERRLVVLGFPCNQSGAQEPGNEQEIQNFCKTTYDVTFPMFAKIDVNGDQAHPLYQELRRAAPAEGGKDAIRWNFTKFLVSRDGKTIKRYRPDRTPMDSAKDIQEII